MKTVSDVIVQSLHDQCVSNGDTHLAAICQIALHGAVQPGTYANLQDPPRKVMADQYGVDSEGVAHLSDARALAMVECLRFARDHQEPISLAKALPEILAVLAGGGGSGPPTLPK